MATEKRGSSEYFLEDSAYRDDGSDTEDGIEEEEYDDEMTGSVDNEGSGVSHSGSLLSRNGLRV
ncbi:hypothetical protein OROGR_013333 [Orobanche gracilis]